MTGLCYPRAFLGVCNVCGKAFAIDNGGGVGIRDARWHCGVSIMFEELVIRKVMQRTRTVQELVPFV